MNKPGQAMRRWVGVFVVISMAVVSRAGAATEATPSSRLGVAWVGSADVGPSVERFQMGAATGAGWDRWVFYWADIEPAPNEFDWGPQDAVFLAEAASGLSINGVLLTTPDHYARGGAVGRPAPRVEDKRALFRQQEARARGDVAPHTPAGQCPGPANTYPPRSLNEPVFVGEGEARAVNPANHWARFVYAAVQRYKPGGELARLHGLPPGYGVRAWEVWNEPDVDCAHGPGDFAGFFNGTPAEYYQLLKVAYQVVKAADPSAQVVTGGLWFWPNQGWFDAFAAAAAADSDKAAQRAHNMYFDAFALHWYSNVHNTLNFSALFARRLRDTGFGAKPLWLTETGLPLIGDDVAPDNPTAYVSGSIEDQASYIVQNVAYALWLAHDAAPGVERVFHFQLYDDGIAGAFGAFGLIRNPAGPAAHPTQPGVPRPGYAAFQTAARYLDRAVPVARDDSDGIERLTFERPDGARVTVVWNWTAEERAVSIPARAASALRVDRLGSTVTLAPSGGHYTLRLPPATNFNQPETPGVAMIGGPPFLVVESGAPTTPTATLTATPTRTPAPTATPPPPTPTLAPGCANLIVDPGFELGGAWTFSRAAPSAYQHYSGAYSAFIGLTAPPAVTTFSSARQTITLPATATTLHLSYARALAAGDAANQQFVELRADGAQLARLEHLNPAATSGWEMRQRDVTELLRPRLGQPVEVYFGVRNAADTAGAAYMRLDDVALVACSVTDPATATPTPLPTRTPAPAPYRLLLPAIWGGP